MNERLARRWRLAVLGVIALRSAAAGAYFFFVSGGLPMALDDSGMRLMLALDWAKGADFFGPCSWWPPLPVWITGLALKACPSFDAAVFLLGTLFYGAAIYLAALTALALWKDPVTAVIAAVLCAFCPHTGLLSLSNEAGLFLLTVLMAALYSWVRLRDREGVWSLLGVSAALALANAIRHETGALTLAWSVWLLQSGGLRRKRGLTGAAILAAWSWLGLTALLSFSGAGSWRGPWQAEDFSAGIDPFSRVHAFVKGLSFFAESGSSLWAVAAACAGLFWAWARGGSPRAVAGAVAGYGVVTAALLIWLVPATGYGRFLGPWLVLSSVLSAGWLRALFASRPRQLTAAVLVLAALGFADNFLALVWRTSEAYSQPLACVARAVKSYYRAGGAGRMMMGVKLDPGDGSTIASWDYANLPAFVRPDFLLDRRPDYVVTEAGQSRLATAGNPSLLDGAGEDVSRTLSRQAVGVLVLHESMRPSISGWSSAGSIGPYRILLPAAAAPQELMRTVLATPLLPAWVDILGDTKIRCGASVHIEPWRYPGDVLVGARP